MRVPISRIDASLPLPAYATAGSAGLDLCCREETSVPPGSLAYLPLNVVIAVPAGHVLLVALRSSTPRRTGLISPTGIGVIDMDYHGPGDEIRAQVFNPTGAAIVVRRGDRVAQALLMPVVTVEWQEGPPLTDADRGGFGSTG